MDEATLLSLREDQKLWEVEAVERGIRRYRNELNKALSIGDEAATPPGTKMMLAIIGHLTEAIERAQVEAETHTESRGVLPAWVLPIKCLSAEKWAYITARTVMSFGRTERPVLQVALAIAAAGKNEKEFENFKKAEDERAGREPGYVSLYDRMARKISTFSPRTVRKWMLKCQQFEKAEWSKQMRLITGSKLIDILVSDDGGGWFEKSIDQRVVRGIVTTSYVVRPTKLTREYLDYHHAQSELTRPWMLPMLSPPNDWMLKQEGQSNADELVD